MPSHLRIFSTRLLLAALLLATGPLAARADEANAAPTPSAATAAEKAFVARAATELAARFPTPSAAERAGYVRYTNEDDTGAISYENGDWTSTQIGRPAQLWYDVHGRLLGADYSQLADAHPRPAALFGISPARFVSIHAHVHYVVRNPDGSLTYSRAMSVKTYAATGLDPQHPTAAGLVKAGAVDAPDRVATVFLYPHIWDVAVWVIPNPNGPFADKNPTVTPSSTPDPADMH